MRERRYLCSLTRLWMLLMSSRHFQETAGFVLGGSGRCIPCGRLGASAQQESETTSTPPSITEGSATPWSSVDRLLQSVGTEIDKIVPHFSDERQQVEVDKEAGECVAKYDATSVSSKENRIRMRRRLDATTVSSVELRRSSQAEASKQHQHAVLLDMLLQQPNSSTPPRRVSQSVIQNAIEDLMQKQQHPASFPSPPTMGLLGDTPAEQPPRIFLQDDEGRTVRSAQNLEDVHIANLRLSVFADVCATTDRRSQFCAHSCQAMAARRRRGATCLVATTARNAIVGSAECSFHEFFGTRLGHCRGGGRTILYVTEVAVHPSARRRGVGRLLLEAMDLLARERDVETLYLHVDVENHAAIRLYEMAGYRRTSSENTTAKSNMYEEFTRSLNLHPGATKGRRHYLLYRDLTEHPTWLEQPPRLEPPQPSMREGYDQTEEEHRMLVDAFGFEIPA